MRNLSKITAIVLTIAMTVSLFAFPAVGFAAEEGAADELVILAAQSKGDVTKVIPKAEGDNKTVKNNKYSAKWTMDNTDGIVINGIPKDISAYNELKMTVYASTAVTSYVYFSTNNADTDGMDYFGRQISFNEGWQEVSIDFNSMGKSREPSWASIAGLELNCSGWSQTKVPGAVVYFDSISLAKNGDYQEVSVPVATPTPTPLPDGEAGNVRYYEEDFEDTDTVNTKSEKDNKITLEEKNGNHYMQITKVGQSDVHVDKGLSNTSRYVILSADYATTQYPKAAQLITCKSATGQHTFVSLTQAGEIKAGGKVIGKIKDDGKFVNVAVAGDFANSIYSVYIDGELAAEDIQMGSGVFGYPTLHRIFLNATADDAGANLMVDNIKIYDGIKLDDYENTIDAEVAAAKAFEDMIGNPSPIIDNGAAIVSYIDQVRSVALNVRSGYIHANGEKYIPDAPAYIKDGRTLLPVRAVSEALGCSVEWDAATRTVTVNGSAKIVIDSTEMILSDGTTYTLDVPAEITSDRTFIPLRALCEKVLGKTVFWDDRGLIILSDSPLSLTAANITALNNYMVYTRPQAEDLKALFASENGNTHPRVILDREGFDKILSEYQTNERMNKWGNNVIKTADQKIETRHEEYIIPDGLRLLATCRNVLSKSLNLSMAYRLTGDEKYKTYLWGEIENVCNFVDWNHKLHYLDTGEMTMAVAIAYDWLYDEWTPEQRAFMEESIYKHSLTWTQKALYGQCDYNHFFVTANTNWNAVCNGGVGVGAIAVFDKYPDLCADILEKNYISLEKMMTEFYPDGAWYEGPGYWEYLMQYLAFFLSTSEAAFNTDFNISLAPGFEKTGQYYLSSDGMTGSNNFHDAGTSRLMSYYLMWYSKHMNQPELTEVLLYKMDRYAGGGVGGIYSLLYYDTAVQSAESVNLPLDSHFGNTEIASLRSSWVDDKGLYVSFHSGKNNVNHAHLDAGTFVADLGGVRFAGDIGAEDYNIDGYWGGKRYQYYRTRPEGHNTFVINPDSSYGQDLNATDKFIAFETKTRGGYAITDLTNSYKPYANSAKRGIMLADERRSIVIRDEIRGMKKDVNEVYWFMQMEKVNVEIVDNTTAILTKGGVRAKLQVLSDADNCEITVTDPAVLPTSPNLPNQNTNPGWSRLAIKFTSGKDLNITVKMSLLYDPLGDSPIVEMPLDQWSVAEGSATIPEGEIPEFPEANGIVVNGESLRNFDPIVTNNTFVLPYGTTEVPTVEVQVDDHIEVAEIALPEALPGIATIKIRDKSDTRLQTVYTVNLRAANLIEIEVSAAQDGNPGEQCLDNDLSTRWAVEGESWGIFRFATPQTISSVWLASWKAAERQLIFDIEVSEDGENFTQVWSGKTAATKDEPEEFKIPAGTYKAVKLVLHGTTTGSWNSLLEVFFK